MASTDTRIGAMHTLKLEDLEKIDDIYKIIDAHEIISKHFTFCTTECAKEIDNLSGFHGKSRWKNKQWFIP